MMNRRTLFAYLPFLGTLPLFKPKLPEGCEILRSFDARDWAKAFVAHTKQLPGMATDEETMTTWFANAMMRGYDEQRWQHDREVTRAGETHVEALTGEAVRGAVARGWCSEDNRHKPMDCDLAAAISHEVLLLAPETATTCQSVQFLQRLNAQLCEQNERLIAANQRLRDYQDRVEAALA